MIECEKCGNYFHADDIRECPKCGLELCEECYEQHVVSCMLEDYDDLNDDYDKPPTYCPNCDEKLELDIDYNHSTLYCEECGFELDVTNELEDEDEDEDEDEEKMWRRVGKRQDQSAGGKCGAQGTVGVRKKKRPI